MKCSSETKIFMTGTQKDWKQHKYV